MKPVVDEARCIACGTCAAVCETKPNVFEVDDVSRVVHPEACTGCGACEENCPAGAIRLVERDSERSAAI